jgi:hypothetical protein
MVELPRPGHSDNTPATWSCTRGTSHERPGTPTSSAPNWPRQLSPGPRELEAGVPLTGVRARDPRAGECARLRSTGSLLRPHTRLGSRRLRHCPPSPSMSGISCGSYATVVASHPDVSTVHRHSDIGYHTPESVHDGLAAGIREQRAAVLERLIPPTQSASFAASLCGSNEGGDQSFSNFRREVSVSHRTWWPTLRSPS